MGSVITQYWPQGWSCSGDGAGVFIPTTGLWLGADPHVCVEGHHEGTRWARERPQGTIPPSREQNGGLLLASRVGTQKRQERYAPDSVLTRVLLTRAGASAQVCWLALHGSRPDPKLNIWFPGLMALKCKYCFSVSSKQPHLGLLESSAPG